MAGRKGRSGRRRKDIVTRDTQHSLTESGKLGARYIRQILDGTVRPNALKLEAARLAIAHAIGNPLQKSIEFTNTDRLTMADMARIAAGDTDVEHRVEGEDIATN